MAEQTANLSSSGAEERLRKLGWPLISAANLPASNLRLSDVLGEPVTKPRSDGEIVADKVILALARWARSKMGKRYRDYVRQAEETFLLDIAAKVKEENALAFWIGVRVAALQAEIKFPRKLRRRNRRKLYELTPTLFKEYKHLHPEVRRVKEIQSWTSRKLAMAELFKDTTKQRIENWCSRSMKPNAVVYEALTIKYFLDIHPDNLKKYLRLIKNRGERAPRLTDIASFLERTLLAPPS